MYHDINTVKSIIDKRWKRRTAVTSSRTGRSSKTDQNPQKKVMREAADIKECNIKEAAGTSGDYCSLPHLSPSQAQLKAYRSDEGREELQLHLISHGETTVKWSTGVVASLAEAASLQLGLELYQDGENDWYLHILICSTFSTITIQSTNTSHQRNALNPIRILWNDSQREKCRRWLDKDNFYPI